MLSEIFWMSVLGTTATIFTIMVRYCYKSKCTNIKMGCVKIQRDVQGEEKLDVISTQINDTV